MPKKIKKYKQQYKEMTKDIKQKIALFEELPDDCSACDAPFDKQDLEQVTSWHVVVRQDKVRLYCPSCWGAAKELVKEKAQEIRDEKEQNES